MFLHLKEKNHTNYFGKIIKQFEIMKKKYFQKSLNWLIKLEPI